MSEHDPRDLVVIALSGVQRYITESRTTADAANASDIVARLAAEAADQLEKDGAELIIPSKVDPTTAPNRIVALAAKDQGGILARQAADKTRSHWRTWIAKLFGEVRDVPGFPEIMWSVAPVEIGSYADQWKAAQVTLAARKRLRAFDYPERKGTRPCSVSPYWPSEKSAPKNTPKHDRNSKLSAAVWLKRRWHDTNKLPSTRSTGFPSTASIASALPCPCPGLVGRFEVHDLVTKLSEAAREIMGPDLFWTLEGAVPSLDQAGQDSLKRWFIRRAGWWVTPDTWNVDALSHEYGTPSEPVDPTTVQRGRDAAKQLAKVVDAAPNPYYAVLSADLDGLGRHLSASPITAERHQRISQRLGDLSRTHHHRIQKNHAGVSVYSGGDDLLAFLPASTALEAAQACREAVDEDPTTLSCSVLFSHQGTPLHTVIARSRALLAEAKKVPNKNAIAVGYITGSGARAHTVRPWRSDWVSDALGALRTFKPRQGSLLTAAEDGGLSPRLINDLYSERAALSDLATRTAHRRIYKAYEAEVTRLVLRHGGNEQQARSLLDLGRSEHAETTDAQCHWPRHGSRFSSRQTW